MSTRKIRKIIESKPAVEGAGVHLRRVFGNADVPLFDPFLMLDDFRSENPDHFRSGFPWHPHRGIETITYVLKGDVEHGDSLGNKGIISSGDIQWMTAGSGIIHQEMPKGDDRGVMSGFQLWANLPASEKMIHPRYRDVAREQIPEITTDKGVKIKIIAGVVNTTEGPVKDILIEPEYLDVWVPPHTEFIHPTQTGHTVFAYVIEGSGSFCKEKKNFLYEVEDEKYFDLPPEPFAGNGSVVLFHDGEEVMVATEDSPVRFLLISGRPLGEPVAWYGPVVMNTQEELEVAFEEYQNGTFLKHKKS